MNQIGYKYKRYILVGALFFLLIIQLIAYNIKGKEKLNIFERVILFVTFPTQNFISSMSDKINNIWEGYIYLVELKKTNLRFEEENEELKNLLNRMNEIKAENERLKNLLAFSQENNDKFISARVVSTGPSNFYHTLIINRGAKEGIKRGMAVITNGGVVGQISYVKEGYSGVITLIDPNSAIDAIDQKTRARGILRGYPFGKLIFKYLPFSEKVYVGDRVVSSGMDGIFNKGLAVGDIVKVENKKENLFQNVVVKPAIDFSRLEEVLVHLKAFEGTALSK